MNNMACPGAKLLLCLSRKIIGSGEEDLSGFFKKNAVDWPRLKDLALYHELFPFFYAELKDFSSFVSVDFLEFSRQGHYATFLRAQKLWMEFLLLADAFRRKHLSMVPLKGIAGLADIYRDCPLRAMADIDVLVKKEDLSKVKDLLADLGYVISLEGLKESYWTEKHCELTFYKKGTVPLDVHFGLDFKRPGVPPLPHLWDRIKRVSLDGSELELLSPEDQLFCLALHQRRFGGKVLCLKNIFDLAMILKKCGAGFDWDYVLREAKAGKMRTTVFFILRQSKTFFAAAIPEFVWKGLRVSRRRREAVNKMIEKFTFALPLPQESKALYLKIHFLLFDSFWEPIRYILDIPIEQFAKYYSIEPYAKKTRLLYGLRAVFFVWQYLCGKVKLCLANSGKCPRAV